VSAANHRLRAWRADDAQVLMDAAAGDIDIARQLPPLETISDAHAHIAKTAGNDDRVAFAIVNGDDVVVGGIAAALNLTMRTAWVSYWLLTSGRGVGLATRATVALADWLFAQNIHRLEPAHRLNNPASQRVAERAGFIREGIMRDELEYDGVRYDTALMSRLPHDPAPAVTPLPGLLT
jgi:RimJ/RimL family protein N-acetyltransferase